MFLIYKMHNLFGMLWSMKCLKPTINDERSHMRNFYPLMLVSATLEIWETLLFQVFLLLNVKNKDVLSYEWHMKFHNFKYLIKVYIHKIA